MTTFRTITKAASICHWDLSIRVLTKEQALGIVTEIMKWRHDVSFEFFAEDHDTETSYEVRIADFPWLENLAELVAALQKYDFGIENVETETPVVSEE